MSPSRPPICCAGGAGKPRALADADQTVRLKLADGSAYGQTGRLQAAEPNVDPQTGVVTLRMQFANPDALLLPGMYVQVEMPVEVAEGVFLVPQEGVVRDRRGRPTVWVVGAENTVEEREISIVQDRESDWVVDDGLQPGDRVMVAGFQKTAPGGTVAPETAARPTTAQRPTDRRQRRREGMARFFIDRPVFAWVISILIMGVGVLAIRLLPVAQYPQIAPPSVTITATYPGASADTVANTVTQVIEQQMTGLDGLRYFSSQSTSAGRTEITLTFETGTDPDIAQVQVQNKLSRATPLLPEIVQRQGITVEKSSAGFLMVVALISTRRARTGRSGRLHGNQPRRRAQPDRGRGLGQRLRRAVRDAHLAGSRRSWPPSS